MNTMLGWKLLSCAAVLASIDLDGYFTGSDFFSILANAITGVLLAFFNMFLFGTTVV